MLGNSCMFGENFLLQATARLLFWNTIDKYGAVTINVDWSGNRGAVEAQVNMVSIQFSFSGGLNICLNQVISQHQTIIWIEG